MLDAGGQGTRSAIWTLVCLSVTGEEGHLEPQPQSCPVHLWGPLVYIDLQGISVAAQDLAFSMAGQHGD